MLNDGVRREDEPGDAEPDAADVVQVDEHERDDHAVPERVHEPADLERRDRARKRRDVHPENVRAPWDTSHACARAFSSIRTSRTSTTAATARAPPRCSRSTSAGSASSSAEPTELPLARAFPGEPMLDEAREALARFVGAGPRISCSTPNATAALNAVIRSLRIRPEEEILTTKHEYGAILRTLEFIARERRSRRARRDRLEHRDPDARRRRLARHVADRARAAGRGDLRRRSPCRSPLRRRRRPRAGPAPARPRGGSGRTCTRATATSGCALRRAPASCGRAASISSGSSLSSSAGGTTRTRTSASVTAGRGRATLPRSSPFRRRSSCTPRSTRQPPASSRTRPSGDCGPWACARCGARGHRSCARSWCARPTPPSSGDGSSPSTASTSPSTSGRTCRLLRVSIGPYNDEADLDRLVDAVRNALARR